MPRLLLINPRFPESFWSFRWALDNVLTERKAMNAPLGLATLAALCPEGWEVQIADEEVEEIPMSPDADIVGICGMGVQAARQRELLEHFRSRGYYTVAGGSYASLCPEQYEGVADTVVSGEAEYIWPQFCRDYEAGKPGEKYKEEGTVDLADSPVPRFDLLKLDRYHTVPLQFSRGCPFRCEFCDIIVMFGRKPRTKSPEQVIAELDALHALGARWPFFVDDNFIGHRPKAKALLKHLVRWQAERGHPLRLGTEVTVDIASDPEMMDLMREAGFAWLFMGIETPDEEALRETGKLQNLRMDTLQAIHTLYAHGLDVYAGLIVGFDVDNLDTIDRLRRFVMTAGIQVAMVNLLYAVPKTPLHERMQKEGRLIDDGDEFIDTGLGTNIIPTQLSYDEMVEAYRQLMVELTSDRGIADRIRAKYAVMNAPQLNDQWPLSYQLHMLGRLMVRGILPGGPRRVYHFARSIPFDSRQSFALALSDWVKGLSTRSYVDRKMSRPAPALNARLYRSRAEKQSAK